MYVLLEELEPNNLIPILNLLFRLGKFMKDNEIDFEQSMIDCNVMLDDPLPNKELQTIIKSVAK